MNPRAAIRRRDPGLSLIETVIAVGISAVVVSSMYTVLRTAVVGDPGLRIRVDLQLDAARVLREVADILRNSRVIRQAAAIPEDRGPIQEIAFRLPRNVDGGDRPTPSATGAAEWDSDRYAILLVPTTAGNELRLRRADAAGAIVSTRILGRFVDRVAFESAGTGPGIRVTAWFRRVEEKKVYTVRQSCTVTPRALGD